MSTVRSYRDLVVWQLGMQLVQRVYQTTQSFPKEEQYGLTCQLRRCAVSIPSNIAEGHARDSTREFLHHISIAMGSLAELETQVELAAALHYLSDTTSSEILVATGELGRKLRGLQKSIRSKVE